MNSILQDPKPLVVGIGWVVECVEQRIRVDEASFSVDLVGMNIAGTNKVRIVFTLSHRPLDFEPMFVYSVVDPCCPSKSQQKIPPILLMHQK